MVTTFRVDVNPFTHIAEISARINKQEFRADIEYNPLDYGTWYSFSMGDDVFDVQFLYDNEFIVKIEDARDLTEQIVKLKINFKWKKKQLMPS